MLNLEAEDGAFLFWSGRQMGQRYYFNKKEVWWEKLNH